MSANLLSTAPVANLLHFASLPWQEAGQERFIFNEIYVKGLLWSFLISAGYVPFRCFTFNCEAERNCAPQLAQPEPAVAFDAGCEPGRPGAQAQLPLSGVRQELQSNIWRMMDSIG